MAPDELLEELLEELLGDDLPDERLLPADDRELGDDDRERPADDRELGDEERERPTVDRLGAVVRPGLRTELEEPDLVLPVSERLLPEGTADRLPTDELVGGTTTGRDRPVLPELVLGAMVWRLPPVTPVGLDVEDGSEYMVGR